MVCINYIKLIFFIYPSPPAFSGINSGSEENQFAPFRVGVNKLILMIFYVSSDKIDDHNIYYFDGLFLNFNIKIDVPRFGSVDGVYLDQTSLVISGFEGNHFAGIRKLVLSTA